MSQLTLVPASGGSPFDQIRRTRPDGSEYWSARALMGSVGYDRWENFSAAIERAKLTANNQGAQVSDHFRDATKVIPGGRWGAQRVADVELSRLGAYLTVMNGDPRKDTIAAAQAYFAVRTRQAEVQAPRELTGPELMAKALIEAQHTLAASQQRIAELQPKAASFDHFLSAANDLSVSVTAQALCRAGAHVGRNRLFQQLADLHWIYRRDGARDWSAYQAQIDAGRLRVRLGHYEDANTGVVHATHTIRITAKGLSALADHYQVTVTREDIDAA